MLASSKSDTRKYESALFDQIMQIAESAPESLVFNFGHELLAQIDSAQSEIAKVEAKNGARSGFAAAMYYITLGSAVVISLWFAADAALSHHLAGINVAVIALVPLAMFDGLSSLPTAFSQLRQVLGAIKNIEPLVEVVEDVPSTSSVDLAIPLTAVLEFRQMHPLIEGARTHKISATVQSGQTLLITGRSGAGKSSVINALLGFVPYSGEIQFNGELLQTGNLNSFSTLLQDDYLFGTSIRENLKIGNPEATDSQLLEALNTVELSEFVGTLPEGLDTMIGAQGYNFSGGEKQRLKLARLLLRDTPIFILDEPYEFLDSEMVERVAVRVSEKMKDKTVVIVSHLPLPIASTTIVL